MDVEAAQRYFRNLSDAELNKELVRLSKFKNKTDTYEHDLYRLGKQEYERRTKPKRKLDKQIETLRLIIPYLANQKQLPTDQFLKAQGIDHLGLTSVEDSKKKRLREKGITVALEKNQKILLNEEERLLEVRGRNSSGSTDAGKPNKKSSTGSEKTNTAVSLCVRRYKELKSRGQHFYERQIAREVVDELYPELTGKKRADKIGSIRNNFLTKLGLKKKKKK